MYLMMRFKWTVNKAIEYIWVKQPWFYIVPQLHKALCLLEDLLRLKHRGEVTGDWDLNRQMNKQETIITHTFINTRIPPLENNKQGGFKDKKTIRSNIESTVPKNNRNSSKKSNTYNENIDGCIKAKTRILWADLAKNKRPLAEIIDSDEIDHCRRTSDLHKIMSHKLDFKPKPIIHVESPQPRQNLWNITSTSKSNVQCFTI